MDCWLPCCFHELLVLEEGVEIGRRGIQGRLHWGPWSWLKKRADKRSVRGVEVLVEDFEGRVCKMVRRIE